jgi:hypothetical protein
MVRHCPRCELRFRSEAELTEHLSVDHDADVSVFERFRYEAAHPLQPLYADLVEPTPPARKRFLVVANQTLHSSELEDVIHDRLRSGPAEVVVLVPATHTADYPGASAGGPRTRVAPDEPGLAQARWRLRKTVEGLRAQGAAVFGMLGPADPYAAVAELVERQRFDEIIMSTLPPEASRWLAMDVPTRIRRLLGVPVTVVSAGRPALAVIHG